VIENKQLIPPPSACFQALGRHMPTMDGTQQVGSTLIVRSSNCSHHKCTRYTTDQQIRLSPCVCTTATASELGLRTRPLLLVWPQRRFQIELPHRCSKLVIGLLEPATRNNEMRHMLTRLTPISHPG